MTLTGTGYLELQFSDLEGETKGLSGQISHFFQSTDPYDQFLRVLKTIKHKRGQGPYRLEIPLQTPLRTKATDAYKRGGGHRQKVVGEISTLWSLRLLGRGWFRVENASTLVKVLEVSATGLCPIAEWRMEVAAGAPPGCFFHTQIGSPVPDWLEVPRLPFIVPTLTTSVEFLLGELFQTEWRRYMKNHILNPNMAQRNIVQHWLKWQEDAVRSASGSSWLALKSAVPSPDTFR